MPARDGGAPDLPAVGRARPEPVGVLTTRSTSPLSIQSTTFGEPSPIFLSSSAGMPMRSIASVVPRVATIRKPRSWSIWATATAPGLSLSVTVMKAVPAAGSARAGRGLGLGERRREVAGDAHDLAGRAHLGAEHRVGAGEAVERQHGLLDRHVRRPASGRPGRSRSARRSPSMSRQAILASGTPTALETNGTVREARGLASMT